MFIVARVWCIFTELKGRGDIAEEEGLVDAVTNIGNDRSGS